MADGDVGGILGGIGSLLSGISNTASSIYGMANARSNARYQAALQRTNQLWSALNIPKAQRQGLEDAGYNPLLAFGNGAGGATSAFQVGSSQGDLGGLGEGLEGLGDALKAKKEEEEQKKKEEHEQEQKDKLFNAQLDQIKATIENINTHSAQRVLENKILQDKIDNRGSIFTALNHVKRGAGDLLHSAWNLYNDNIGQPFANMVHKVFK